MADQKVTVEGSMTPCSELPRGVRKTVLYTDRVQRMINKGYFVMVSEPVDTDSSVPAAEPEKTEPPAAPPQTDVKPPSNPFLSPQVPQHPNESAQPSGEPAGTQPVQSETKPTP